MHQSDSGFHFEILIISTVMDPGFPKEGANSAGGNVFPGICHSVCNQPYGYSVTAHACYSAVGRHPTGIPSCLA